MSSEDRSTPQTVGTGAQAVAHLTLRSIASPPSGGSARSRKDPVGQLAVSTSVRWRIDIL